MANVKKVIAGLKCCKEGADYTDPICGKCPYREEGAADCVPLLAADALELLVAYEPRVMTLIEWIRAPEPADGECMCYEIKDKGLQAMLVKAFDGAKHLYGKAFRCWTSRPDEKMREATPWDAQEQREYEAAVEMAEHCERYEPTYNADDGSM